MDASASVAWRARSSLTEGGPRFVKPSRSRGSRGANCKAGERRRRSLVQSGLGLRPRAHGGIGEAEQPLPAEQEHPPAAREQPRDRRVAHIQPAGVGAQRRQQQPPRVGHETGPRHHCAAHRHLRLRMEMPGNLARRPGHRLVAEHQRPGPPFRHRQPADARRRGGVVVAEHPDEIRRRRHRRQPRRIGRQQPRRAARVVERIAQRHHRARRVPAQQRGQPVERGPRVPGRQQRPARRRGRAFLQMQVGHRQQPLRRPDQRAVGVEHQPLAGQVQRREGHRGGWVGTGAA